MYKFTETFVVLNLKPLTHYLSCLHMDIELHWLSEVLNFIYCLHISTYFFHLQLKSHWCLLSLSYLIIYNYNSVFLVLHCSKCSKKLLMKGFNLLAIRIDAAKYLIYIWRLIPHFTSWCIKRNAFVCEKSPMKIISLIN